ncbi:MAG: hypothetical protein ACXVY8_04145 [Gaiellaceae bacterium]
MREIDLGPCRAVFYAEERERCAVLLPGAAYTAQAPLLWFARETALSLGWGAIEIQGGASLAEGGAAWARDRSERALAAAEGRRLLVVGKSLSSLAAAVAVERELPAIWFTPLLTQPVVLEAFGRTRRPTLMIGSRSDPSWGQCSPPPNPNLRVLELEGLDHSLQRPGDPVGSLEVLRSVCASVSDFLLELEPA